MKIDRIHKTILILSGLATILLGVMAFQPSVFARATDVAPAETVTEETKPVLRDMVAHALSERSFGSADAPLVLLEFSSFTCPHCARFHSDILPTLKQDYIDTGKLRLVFSDFPLDRSALMAGAAARCLPKDRYETVLETLFMRQQQWATAADPEQALADIFALAGMSRADFNDCVGNEAILNGIAEFRFNAQRDYDINSTPSFVFAGEDAPLRGTHTLEAFITEIDKRL